MTYDPFSNWVFPKVGVPQNGWFIMENPIKMDDLVGFPPIFGNTQLLMVEHGWTNQLGGNSLWGSRLNATNELGKSKVPCRIPTVKLRNVLSDGLTNQQCEPSTLTDMWGGCFGGMWVFPKIGGKPPKSSILIGFSIIFTIHFGFFPPFFGSTPMCVLMWIRLASENGFLFVVFFFLNFFFRTKLP